MQRPSPSGSEDSHLALYHHFNVSIEPVHAGAPLPTTLNVPVLRDARLPTHILAISSPSGPESEHLMIPIHSDLFMKKFRVNVLPPSQPGRSSPTSHGIRPHRQAVTLPVVPVSVPHVPSISLLLLFGLGFETQTNLLAWRLLPPYVIEEFPNAAAMAQVMARTCSEEQLQRYVIHNQGLWKNILALGPRDMTIVELVQTAWNVTADARRIRQRAWGLSPPQGGSPS